MIRLFVDCPLSANVQVTLDNKKQHYLLHVMRCKEDDFILCFNGQDGEWRCRLKTSKKQAALIAIEQARPQVTSPFCALCPALIKKDNMDLVLQKATELGITDIYPIISDRTVHAHFNRAHAQSVVQEAAEQCERITLPIIHEPTALKQLVKLLPKTCTNYYLAERATQTNTLPQKGDLAFFVGPEGGWTPQEIAFFEKNAFHPLHLSVGILRAETASIAILSCWQIGREICLKK